MDGVGPLNEPNLREQDVNGSWRALRRLWEKGPQAAARIPPLTSSSARNLLNINTLATLQETLGGKVKNHLHLLIDKY
jgi:hypothetical protein